MQQRNIIHTTLFILLGASFFVQSAIGACNTCGPNGIACINETSFYICSNNEIVRSSGPYLCLNDGICSSIASPRCLPSGATPDCSPTETCAGCVQNNMFACTSRTTYVICDNNKATQITGTCPNGFTCDTSTGGEICKSKCKLPAVLDCDLAQPL